MIVHGPTKHIPLLSEAYWDKDLENFLLFGLADSELHILCADNLSVRFKTGHLSAWEDIIKYNSICQYNCSS